MCTNQQVKNIISQLCSGLKPLFPQSSMDAIVFGSYARGEEESDSDIDVMVLVDSSRQEISGKLWQIGDVAADILLNSGVVVLPIVENRNYFQQNASFFPLYKNIIREGVSYDV